MGIGDIPYSNPTTELGWQHCLTVPCELTIGCDGKLLRNPIAELEKLITHKQTLTYDKAELQLPFDLKSTAQQDSFELVLGGAVQMIFENGVFTLKFLDEKFGCGRDLRRVKLDSCESIRVLADKTSLEIFLNGGEKVLSTRFYPSSTIISVDARGLDCEAAELRAMEVSYLGK
jgi:beta-fructofuranosidase